MWALGNMADTSTFRDLILKCGGLEYLLTVVNKTTNEAIIKHGIWAISNLCRGRPFPDLNQVSIAIPTLSAFIQKEFDVAISIDVAWAICHLSKNDNSIQAMASAGIIPALIHQLE